MKRILISITVCLFVIVNLSAQIKKETFTYSVKGGQELLLDKYENKSVNVNGSRPVIIYVHGGGFSTGSRINAMQIKFNKHFANQGFVSISIEYRLGLQNMKELSNQSAVLNAVSMAVEDLTDATAFIISKAKEWNIDPNKIIISGGSAGAITCLTAEYDISSKGTFYKRLPDGFNYAGVISHAGCVITKQDTITWGKNICPMLLMQGSVDQLVPFEKSKFPDALYAGSSYLHKQFTTLDVPHWLYEEVGADHIVAMKPLEYNFAETDVFVDRLIMKGQHAIIHTKWADKKPDSMTDMQKVVPDFIFGWDKTDEQLEMEQNKQKLK